MTATAYGHDFDRLARYYDRGLSALLFGTGGQGRLRRAVARALRCEGLQRGSRVLEVGCGTAENLRALAEACPGCHVMAGVDFSLPMLAEARKKRYSSPVVLARGDAGRLPFADGTFQAVIISFLLHELPPEKRRQAIAEAVRVLGPGGCCLLVEMARPASAMGRAVFPFLRIIEPREALVFFDGGVAELLAETPLELERREGFLLGLVEVALYRRRRETPPAGEERGAP